MKLHSKDLINSIFFQACPQSIHIHLYLTMSARWCCGMAFLTQRKHFFFFFPPVFTDFFFFFSPFNMRTDAVFSTSHFHREWLPTAKALEGSLLEGQVT